MMTRWETSAGRWTPPNGYIQTVVHQVTVDGTRQRVKRIWAHDSGGSTSYFDSGQYSYDAAGNITAMVFGQGDVDRTFGYDGLGRLGEYQVTGPTGSSWEYTYHYDDFGNNSGYDQIWYPPPNQAGTSSADSFVPLPIDPFSNRLADGTYDNRGNLTAFPWPSSSPPGSWVQHARFDNRNRLMAVWGDGDAPPLDSYAFAYDNAGERVLRYRVKDGAVQDAHFFLRDEGGNVLTRFHWRPPNYDWSSRENWFYRGREAMARCSGSGLPAYTSLIADHLGSTRAAVRKADTGVYSVIDYMPFGDWAYPEGLEESHLFTAHEREFLGSDPNTSPLGNLDYMHARYYDHRLFRFMSMDPMGGSVGSSQSWNRYSYASSNPLRFLDPDGRGLLDATAGVTLSLAWLKLSAWASGYMSGGTQTLGSMPTNYGSRTGISRTNSFAEGSRIGAWSAEHPVTPLIEAKVSFTFGAGRLGGLDAIGGISLVNFDDPYVLLGGGKSFTASARASLTATLSFGFVTNYQGKGSFGGKFYTSSFGLFPIGGSVSGTSDPSKPRAFTLDLTNAIGISENRTQYWQFPGMDDGTKASTVVRCNGGYHFANQCQ